MKQLFSILISLGLLPFCTSAQQINSGAVSNNNIAHSVGEVFVLPENDSDKNGSGTIAIASQSNIDIVNTENIADARHISTYPIPAGDYIYFSTEGTPIEKTYIYDSLGRLINISIPDGNQIDLHSLKAGIYFLRFNDEKSEALKIIKN